jgi:hypothetical protein
MTEKAVNRVMVETTKTERIFEGQKSYRPPEPPKNSTPPPPPPPQNKKK